ncbi:sugar phosphate isomerase/epimerase family protein [Ruania zhangjianzhongii]|uniref:sugar phosphate isomerase/epimerase family protein n=1 Tax=Ruania zhangjianzhongii TaxID=2603206 RepID=UPI0011C79892|nr:sugar phosphate isomerase/epimerase [Ruania zhangjianzhongii]
MARIGVQLMTVREKVTELGVAEVLRRLAAAGLPVIEVSQVAMTEENVAAMVRARGEHGVEFGALSGTMEAARPGANPSLVEEYDDVVAQCRSLGASRVRIGMMPLTAMRDLDSILAFCRAAEETAQRLAEDGIQLSYHHHHVEFARIGGRQVMDLINDEAPSLAWEIDVHWVARGGADPVRTLQRFAPRVDLVHLKDFRLTLPPAEVIDAAAAGDREAFGQFWGNPVQFAEVGSGNLEWGPIVEAGIAAGAEYLFIEQDSTYGRDPFEALAASRAALVELGYASML